uniref:hypothetical protein n=1 Tax=Deinococcus sp. TaxID=47478 RepID=UPI0025EAB718
MKLRTTLLFFLGLIVGASSLARAQDSEQLSSDFVKVYTVVSYVATVKGFCDGAVPASKAANTAALGAWKTANNMAQIESLTVTFTRKLPSVSDSLSAIRSKMLVKVKQSAAGKEANYCGQLPGLLKDPATQVGQKYKAEIAQLAQTMSGTPAATTMPPQSGSSTAAGTLKLESGHYDCTKYVVRTASGEAFALKYDSVPKNSAAPWGTFDLFANGEYSYESKTSIELPSSPLDWPKTMGRYVTYFNNEANVNQIDWKTGGYGDYNGRFERSYTTSDDKPNYYKTGKDGRLVVILDTQGRGDWINTVECHRKGSTVRKSPTQMMQAAETAETYLQPARVRAAPPPGGSGGLQGVYLGERPLYLSKSGYSSYDWRWGFDRLDCTRALIPGAPLKKCGSYQVK